MQERHIFFQNTDRRSGKDHAFEILVLHHLVTNIRTKSLLSLDGKHGDSIGEGRKRERLLRALMALEVADLFLFSNVEQAHRMRAEKLFRPHCSQAEIALNDVRGFAEQCLAFAPVPSPIA